MPSPYRSALPSRRRAERRSADEGRRESQQRGPPRRASDRRAASRSAARMADCAARSPQTLFVHLLFRLQSENRSFDRLFSASKQKNRGYPRVPGTAIFDKNIRGFKSYHNGVCAAERRQFTTMAEALYDRR